MGNKLKFAVWNANGLSQHKDELQTFIVDHKIDLMMISETHFTKHSFMKLRNYSIYHTLHPDGTAHGGSAIIIKNNIKHHEGTHYKTEHIQATSVSVEDWAGPINFNAIYCPPKHTIKVSQFKEYFNKLGNRFISGGDYNAKHEMWGSRLNTTRGRELQKTVTELNLGIVSTGEPTYWPADPRKIPDLLDFCIIKGINAKYLNAKSCFELSSDHSPVNIILSSAVIYSEKPCYLSNKKTNWNYFKYQAENNLNLSIPLKTRKDIEEALEHFNKVVQDAAWNATPPLPDSTNSDNCTTNIREKIAHKRRLRKQWQQNRSPQLKRELNRTIKEIKELLAAEKNHSIQQYLQKLDPTEATDYSLWKATRRLKRPITTIPPIRTNQGKWAKSHKDKAEVFAKHLKETFTPNLEEPLTEEDKEIDDKLREDYQLELPPKKFTHNNVKNVIKFNINPKKAPGYDLINGKILQELPERGTLFLTQLFNALIRTSYYPSQWKVAQITLILKPGKNPEDVKSYRPVSLLPVASKIFEKLLLSKLTPILDKNNLIPKHQFGFRQNHSTIQQVHRVINRINDDFENKRYCSAVFLDIGQAFDKVWHKGLLYKLKCLLPNNFYMILRDYLEERHFRVKLENEYTELQPIHAGVPQGSVLGPILYLIYTFDLPTTPGITTATFADDTAILASNRNPTTASEILQENLYNIQKWLKKWKIKTNENKSVHITFSIRKDNCPPVKLNNKEIPQSDNVKYLGLHLDKKLTWKTHIFTKRKQLGLKLRKLYWLVGAKSELSRENKLLLYKAILKPIWTYGIELWGTASHSNIEIIQRFQSKMLRIITKAPWFITNKQLHEDLQVPFVEEEVKKAAKKYKEKLKLHPNILAKDLMKQPRVIRRLKRKIPADLV